MLRHHPSPTLDLAANIIMNNALPVSHLLYLIYSLHLCNLCTFPPCPLIKLSATTKIALKTNLIAHQLFSVQHQRGSYCLYSKNAQINPHETHSWCLKDNWSYYLNFTSLISLSLKSFILYIYINFEKKIYIWIKMSSHKISQTKVLR